MVIAFVVCSTKLSALLGFQHEALELVALQVLAYLEDSPGMPCSFQLVHSTLRTLLLFLLVEIV